MAQFRDEEPTSGFVRPDDILKSERFTDFSVVPSRGYSLLVRAKRNGRWWILKGLFLLNMWQKFLSSSLSVIVESTYIHVAGEGCLVLAAEALIGITYHRRYESLAVWQVLIVLDDLL